MKRKIIELVNIIKDCVKDTKLDVPDEIILREALSCYRGEMASSNKNKNDNLPTPKQDKFIRDNKESMIKHGFNVDDIQTKQEASKVISAYLTLLKGDDETNY